jgi:beta-fructofuranosidase
VLRLADHWVWDSWHVRDGAKHHLFFLRASRALLDPDRRHHRAAIGHATSTDLRRWELQADALVHSDLPAWDDRALWTGSVVRQPDGAWRMFYTGVSHAEKGRIQRIGAAVSDDLETWSRCDCNPLIEADPRWYEKLDPTVWTEETWRDPYVFADPEGDGWHMLITARAREGGAGGRGVVGHARSKDLVRWEILPPLTEPAGFGHLEVLRAAVVDGRPVLMFSCRPEWMDAARRSRWDGGGVWIAPGESLLGPWDLDAAATLDHPSLYAGQLVQDRDGDWFVIGFRDTENGTFVGEITDPLRVERHGQSIRLTDAAAVELRP